LQQREGNAVTRYERAQVEFRLHPTFPNPIREVLVHPFEIEEHGWGEFEVVIVVRILWQQSLPIC